MMGHDTRQITLFKVAVMYTVCGIIGSIAIGKVGTFR
jgi:hypothetical protein